MQASRLSPIRRNASFSSFLSAREAVKELEERLSFSQFPLTPTELAADDIVRKHKMREIEAGLRNSKDFLAGQHFFRVKEKIEQSEVFKLIQLMPKGALLHAHNTAMVSSDWLIKNATYRPGLIIFTDQKNITRFTFKIPNSNQEWNYVSDLRNASKNVTAFDEWLETKINLYTPNPEIDYPDIDTVWTAFQNMFTTTSELITFRPVFVDYHRQILKELSDDNVMYVELRIKFETIYDDTEKIYTPADYVEILLEVIEDFKKENPNFLGAKVILSCLRNDLVENNLDDIEIYSDLMQLYPDFIIGIDVASQEKVTNTNIRFSEVLLNLPESTKFFLHAGETNWYGTGVDENLIDAILLNTTRIGHGFALVKHPYLMEIVKKHKIGIEVSPVSNQVLHLVSDMRNHPASVYLSQDLPVTISSDDPGFWGVKGLSYDYYYAFMGIASASAGLETLKKFTWTSLEQSILTDKEWMVACEMFHKQWNKFIEDLIQNHSSE
ncbi:Adenosine deaminase [Sergentomyia squamirostris]